MPRKKALFMVKKSLATQMIRKGLGLPSQKEASEEN